MRNCSVLCLTETWLNDNMPDPAFQLDGRLLFLYGGVCYTAVYIPPVLRLTEALKELLNNNISSLQHTTHPEGVLRGCGGFQPRKPDRDTCLSSTSSMSPYQHGEITRWTVFTPTNETHTEPCHTPKQRTITVWPSDAVPALQDCFQRTDWQIFREAAACEGEVDLEDYTSAVLGYISKCTEGRHQHQDSN
ncbi:hypothetical protein L3Q82_009450 [Scortum barcoo]|uniref:Uncharacterized protein n=1 Tax=Scortum barcoo TaxID=214431 RepID=A0ACB8WFH2_9TELE|nr:hypothetical protein L3Q82_009450 [Scortum barcoo]